MAAATRHPKHRQQLYSCPSKKSTTMNEHIRREVGYILLEECEVLLTNEVNCPVDVTVNAEALDGNRPISNFLSSWQTVDLPSVCADNDRKGDGTDWSRDFSDLILRRCSSTTDQSVRWMCASDLLPFNGLVSEVKASSAKQSSNSNAPKRRSDASLLFGLGIEINQQADRFQEELPTASSGSGSDTELSLDSTNALSLRHLRMEHVQILLWEPNSPNKNLEDESNLQMHSDASSQLDCDTTELGTSSRRIRSKASILMTFSLPELALFNNVKEPPSNVGTNKAKRNKSKMLSTAHQLLASIIRCDWDHLDARMKILQDKALSREHTYTIRKSEAKTKPQFFPDVLNVEELYGRISGASQRFSKAHNCNAASHSSEANPLKKVDFLSLPSEIIASSIAPYLRAKTLHALRVTNRKLHTSLRAVVPGLKLKLFNHQIRSLEWMEMRERNCVTEGDLLCRQSGNNFGHEREGVCGGDYHRAVTGGATVLLAPRSSIDGDLPKAIRFDAESGFVMSSLECSRERQTVCARGGLLCDDPGLGKTITVISLILRSIGVSTEVESDTDRDGGDEELFHLYWRSSFLTDHIRRPALLKLISHLIKSDSEAVWFVPPIDESLDNCPDYYNFISKPICLQDIRNKCEKSDCRNFKEFEADVKLCFSNAMTYNPPDHPVHQAAERLTKKFEELVAEFKSKQIITASKSMHRHRAANSPSERSLVDGFEAKKMRELKGPLVSSSSTLLVVPDPLLNHWQEQMMLHIDFGYVLKHHSSSPFIYYHTSKRKQNISLLDASVSLDLKDIFIYQPLIFIDDGSKKLPHPEVLASFSIVLTSYKRFTSAWKSGSLEQEIRASKQGCSGSNIYWGDDTPEASPILKVSWLRVIIDEGHVMGKNTSNLIQFASWITSQRTWAMTGTPTQQIATQSSIRNLYFLVNFLRHGFFNRHLGREKCWNDLISSGWQCGRTACFFRLKNLLSYLMVRHTKDDLGVIPPPVYSTTHIKLSQPETISYNTIVSSIRANIITTSMDGKTSGWQDSLLNPGQYRHATRALTNMKTACCGGLRIVPTILPKHWDETLVMCRETHGLDDVKVEIVNNFIFRSTDSQLSGCHFCGIQLQTLFVIPCGHLVCTECINNETTLCPVCDKPFDADEFQRLQPGFTLQFGLNLLKEKEERETNHALEREISASIRPGNVIEIDENREEEARPGTTQARPHKRGESCVYSTSCKDGMCKICREEHFDCNFMNSKQQCSICYKHAEEPPAYASKASYVINKLLDLLAADNNNGSSNHVSPVAARFFSINGFNRRPLKAIVFSEFRELYEYFGDRVIRRFGGACVADFSYGGSRSQELHKFIHHPECFVMLLSKQGSVGLDLSFVTHIFFLDSTFDKSLKAQVVARAYRMGATGSVHVEELIAENSVEEIISQMVSGYQVKSGLTSDSLETQAKVHRLLKSAKLIKSQKRKIMNGNQQTSSKQHVKTVRFND